MLATAGLNAFPLTDIVNNEIRPTHAPFYGCDQARLINLLDNEPNTKSKEDESTQLTTFISDTGEPIFERGNKPTLQTASVA